jgi:hypothetical protein
MTQAKRVHSTPPTNTPIDTRRRHFLSLAAGAAVAAAIPNAAPVAASAIDPIYAVIERHKQAHAVHDAAASVRADFYDIHMSADQRKQLAAMEEAVDEAWEQREEAAIDLVNTKPTTLAGIVALCRYVGPLFDADGSLPDVIHWDDDTNTSAAGAFANVIAASIEGLIKIQAGKAVLS